MSEFVCKITGEETEAIRNLYEKKMALENLAKIVSPSENGEMYERLIADYGETLREFNEWWATVTKTYHLPADNYAVDFAGHQLIRATQD